MFSALCPTSLRVLFPRVCANSTSELQGSTGSEGGGRAPPPHTHTLSGFGNTQWLAQKLQPLFSSFPDVRTLEGGSRHGVALRHLNVRAGDIGPVQLRSCDRPIWFSLCYAPGNGDWATCSLCEEASSLGQRVGVTVCEWNQLCGIWGWSGGDTLVLRPPDLRMTLKGPAASSVLSLGPLFGYFGPASRPLAVYPRSLYSLHELEPDANQAHVWC